MADSDIGDYSDDFEDVEDIIEDIAEDTGDLPAEYLEDAAEENIPEIPVDVPEEEQLNYRYGDAIVVEVDEKIDKDLPEIPSKIEKIIEKDGNSATIAVEIESPEFEIPIEPEDEVIVKSSSHHSGRSKGEARPPTPDYVPERWDPMEGFVDVREDEQPVVKISDGRRMTKSMPKKKPGKKTQSTTGKRPPKGAEATEKKAQKKHRKSTEGKSKAKKVSVIIEEEKNRESRHRSMYLWGGDPYRSGVISGYDLLGMDTPAMTSTDSGPEYLLLGPVCEWTTELLAVRERLLVEHGSHKQDQIEKKIRSKVHDMLSDKTITDMIEKSVESVIT